MKNSKGNPSLVIGGALLLGVAGIAGFFLYKNYKGEQVFAGLGQASGVGQYMPLDVGDKDYNTRKMEAYWARRADQRNELRNQQIRSYLSKGGSYA